MGSANIDATVWFDEAGDGYGNRYPKDLKAAFRKLVDDARFEHGHGGYTGSFAEKGGDGVVERYGHPVTETQARAMVYGSEASGWNAGRIDKLNKWGPCEAIPLVRTTPAKYKDRERRTVEITLAAKDLASDETLAAAVTEAVGGVSKATKPGQVEVIGILPTYDKATLRLVPPHVTKRTKFVAGKAKLVTRYFLTGSDLTLPTNAAEWLAGYESLAAARADVERRANPYRGIAVSPVELEIVGVTRRADGTPAVTATVKATQVSASFTVDTRCLETPAKDSTAHAGWLIYGWASS